MVRNLSFEVRKSRSEIHKRNSGHPASLFDVDTEACDNYSTTTAAVGFTKSASLDDERKQVCDNYPAMPLYHPTQCVEIVDLTADED